LQHSSTKRQSKKAAGFSKTITEQILKARLLFKIAGGLLRKRWREFYGKQAGKIYFEL
jgi:hypothetical protein